MPTALAELLGLLLRMLYPRIPGRAALKSTFPDSQQGLCP